MLIDSLCKTKNALKSLILLEMEICVIGSDKNEICEAISLLIIALF